MVVNTPESKISATVRSTALANFSPPPVVKSSSAVQTNKSIQSDTISERSSTLAQIIRTIVAGLGLLLSYLSHEWAVFILRVLNFSDPFLNGSC